jgi:N-acetylglucosaminyldiphosphoundecaprenol N-acetyl-beta-D-mannosaminyltransferase
MSITYRIIYFSFSGPNLGEPKVMSIRTGKKEFLGIPIDDLSIDEIIDRINERTVGKTTNIMSANITALRYFNEESRYFSGEFDILTADGKGLVFFSKMLGEKINNHIRICDLSDALIENAYNNSNKVYLLGAQKESNTLAQQKILEKYPGIQCRGHHGYFLENDMDKIIREMKNFQPDLIIVGISSPKKERVILNIAEKYSGSVNIASGGYIDIVAGIVNSAPIWVQKMGIEWVYRFVQEPKRMFGPMVLSGFYFLMFVLPKAFFKKAIYNKQLNIFDENNMKANRGSTAI